MDRGVFGHAAPLCKRHAVRSMREAGDAPVTTPWHIACTGQRSPARGHPGDSAMSSTTSSRDVTVAPPAPAREPGTLGRLAERIGQALSPVPMRIELWNGTVLRPIQDPPRATLRLTRRRRLLKLLLSPSFQLSEAYRTGELEVHADLARTLTALFRRDHRPEPP